MIIQKVVLMNADRYFTIYFKILTIKIVFPKDRHTNDEDRSDDTEAVIKFNEKQIVSV
uniref:Uncharacterized protein n=1 Tax=Arion vulgaris TaxID=1028688 RepID=A0A0B6Z7J3_9EUPU